MLFLHGGGYIVGSAYGYRPLVGALVAAAGVGALVPDFRLAPEHPFPAALEDALSAYRWLLEQRGGAGIVLAGDSAGAGLACSLMLTLRAQELPLPAGAVFLCPGVDPTGNAILSAAAGGEPPEELADIHRSIEAYLAGHPVDDPIVNPLVADLTGLPPMLVQTATGDIVLPESRLLAERAHGARRRRALRALQRRHPRLPRVLVVPPGGRGRAPARRRVRARATVRRRASRYGLSASTAVMTRASSALATSRSRVPTSSPTAVAQARWAAWMRASAARPAGVSRSRLARRCAGLSS